MKRIALLALVVCPGLFAADTLMAAVTLTTLHIFRDTDGNAPVAALVQGTNGNFYGTTSYGGTGTSCIGGCGTVFEISTRNSSLSPQLQWDARAAKSCFNRAVGRVTLSSSKSEMRA